MIDKQGQGVFTINCIIQVDILSLKKSLQKSELPYMAELKSKDLVYSGQPVEWYC